MANMPVKRWTSRREKFCRELVAGKEQAEAYRLSYDASNMLDTSIYCEASKLANDPTIRQRVSELREEAEAAAKLTDELIIKESLRLATYDVMSVYRDDGTLKPMREWPVEARKAVSAVKMDENGVIREVKFHSKDNSLERMAKVRGMFDNTLNLKHSYDDKADPSVDPIEAYKSILSVDD